MTLEYMLANDIIPDEDIYKACMLIGNRFKQKYSCEETEEWSASEECATVAKLTYEMMTVLNISMEKALDIVMENVLENGFRKVENHYWTVYTRGFLAGEIIGMPTEKNWKMVKYAEDSWNWDTARHYGYYQEALEEAIKAKF